MYFSARSFYHDRVWDVSMLVYVATAHLFSWLNDVSLDDSNIMYMYRFLLMNIRLFPGFAVTNNIATNILVYTCKNSSTINT